MFNPSTSQNKPQNLFTSMPVIIAAVCLIAIIKLSAAPVGDIMKRGWGTDRTKDIDDLVNLSLALAGAAGTALTPFAVYKLSDKVYTPDNLIGRNKEDILTAPEKVPELEETKNSDSTLES